MLNPKLQQLAALRSTLHNGGAIKTPPLPPVNFHFSGSNKTLTITRKA